MNPINIVLKHKILVVEDDDDIQHVIGFFLKRAGFEVLAASNGQDAIEVIPTYHPDLIILDLMMYPVSGWDVLHWLRIQHLLPSTPVLLLTALVHLAEQLHGFEEGAVEYLTKPTQPSTIVERVCTLLSLTPEQRLLLQHQRMSEQRSTLERIQTLPPDEFVY